MTTQTESAPHASERRPSRFGKVARRGFLGSLGAGGLTAASAMFGRSAPAYALCVRNCCNLSVCPNIAWSTCVAHAYYIWSCTATGGLWCQCCESDYGGYQRSTRTCRYN